MVSELLKRETWVSFAQFLTVFLLCVAWIASVAALAIAAGRYVLPATTIILAVVLIAVSLLQLRKSSEPVDTSALDPMNAHK